MQANLMGSRPNIHGEYTEGASIVIHHGEALEFLRTVPSNSIQLIVTSPPYNIGKPYEKSMALQDYLNEQTSIIGELVRCLANNGSICWEVGNFVENGEVFPLDILYYPIFKKYDLKLRNRIIWHFGHGLHASKRFSGRYETLMWFTKSDKYFFDLDSVRVPSKYPGKTHYKGINKGKPSGNPLGKNPSDVWAFIAQEWEQEIWEIPNVKANHPEKTVHPCQFPIELVERCILALTVKNDWVLDPYMGVGSTLLAGIMHNRKVMGCDWERDYVDSAIERVHQLFSGHLKFRKIGTPVYQPTGREKVSQLPLEWKNGD